jgi:hypothetical protein
MTAPVLRHHPLVCLGDGDPPHGTLEVAMLLACLEKGRRSKELCLLCRLDVWEV